MLAAIKPTVSPSVPASRDDVAAAWLTAAWQSTGAIGAKTRVTACESQPVVAFTLSGKVREDGGGLSGPQIIRLQLRRCLKSLMLGNPSYHQVSHGDVNHRLAALREELIILVQSPVFV